MRGIAVLKKLLAALAFGAGSRSPRRASPALADEIEVTDARLSAAEEGVVLAADFAFELGPRLAEVVTNGVPLYFVVEFELTRPRWYWFDEKTAAKRLQLRLSYHPLSRQYRLSTGVLQQNYANARGSAERAAPRAQLAGGGALAPRSPTRTTRPPCACGSTSRMLPKPFQLSAITSRELNLESPWRRFIFRPPVWPRRRRAGREPRAPRRRSAR